MSNQRIPGRSVHRTYRCPSCDVRMVTGHPSPNAPWFQRLRLTDEVVDLITLAAAEFDDFADRFEDRPTAVEFADWLRPDVTGQISLHHPEFDGAPARNVDGSLSLNPGSNPNSSRHPDPIPYFPRRRAS